MNRIPKSLFAMLTALFCLTLTGCGESGPTVYPISGKVVFADGSPAMFGSIEFRSAADEPMLARGKIKKDGSFSARTGEHGAGLVAGWHDVTIMQVVGSPRGGGSIIHNHGLETAKKYGNYETTDLRIEVKPEGDNEFELLVESKK